MDPGPGRERTRLPDGAYRVAMLSVGEYRFAQIDIRRTVRYALDVVDDAAHPHRHTALADVRREVARLVDGIDADADPIEAVAAVVPEVWAALLRIPTVLDEAGRPTARTGRVAHLALSDGGVPKRSVETIDVTHAGAVGDRQRSRRHHGAPFQALCVWDLGVIERLQEEGHPIVPGAAGENITLEGIPWREVRPGATLTVGSVECVVSGWAEPCAKNSQWFHDRDHGRIHHERGALSRVYATVLTPGTVRTGDLARCAP